MSDLARIDSCRNCGEYLEVITTCVVCDQPSQFKCSNCFHFVDDPVHTSCVVGEELL